MRALNLRKLRSKECDLQIEIKVNELSSAFLIEELLKAYNELAKYNNTEFVKERTQESYWSRLVKWKKSLWRMKGDDFQRKR